MAKINETGIFLDSKTQTWGYRIKMKDGTGAKVDTRITGFKNKTEASTARQAKVAELKQRQVETFVKDYTKTFQQIDVVANVPTHVKMRNGYYKIDTINDVSIEQDESLFHIGED